MKYILVVVGIFVCVTIIYMISNRHVGSRTDTMRSDQDIAIEIATEAVTELYPDMIRYGQPLLLEQVSKIVGKEHEWFVKFDTEHGNDMKVEVVVNVKTKQVISLQDSWA